MKNVGIICGGYSSEFEISMLSATTIFSNFPDGYTPYMVVLQRSGWSVQMNGEAIPVDSTNLTFSLAGKTVQIDLAIIYIHGDPGENGKVQSYLEMIQIPYINSGPLASQLSFDKWYCNQFLRGFGVKVAKSHYLTSMKDFHGANEIVAELGLPLFVKPCDSGSSFGIARVNKLEDLETAVKNAFDEGDTVVIEAFLGGTEVTCGVYRNKMGVKALPLTEIVSKNEFFDYEAKYKGLSDEITPARISDPLTLEVQEIAKKIYTLLNLRSIARVDFMIVDSVPHVIEVNTIPGFSNESLVPQMIQADQMTIKEFWTQILEVELA